MTTSPEPTKLEKELGLFDVFALATGATLSFGLFLLPGLAAASVGSALPIAYLIAAVFLLPGLLAKAELATAMPRSGGVYFFLDRAMGPLWGTMSGFGTWFSLILKTAFALVGVGAYLGLFFPSLPIEPVAAALAIFFGVINLLGAKKSGAAQVYLVIGLLVLVAWFCGFGLVNVELNLFSEIMTSSSGSLISTAGFVVVAYMGLTKVAGVAGEVKNPQRNLPLGMILAYITTIVCYLIGTSVMVGVLGSETLAGDLTPVASAAEVFAGQTGSVVMIVAAVLGIFSVANAGVLSASRYPLAMSRDHLLPDFLGRVSAKTSSPVNSVLLTIGVIVLFVTVLNPVKIAKLASAFQLLMFAMSSTAVIVMRESRIESYDPEFRSPFYPWLQLAGIAACVWLIFQMGADAIGFTIGLLWFGGLWYKYYAADKVDRSGAIFRIFERLGRGSSDGIDDEISDLFNESVLRQIDLFDHVIARSHFVEISGEKSFEEVVLQASAWLARSTPLTAHKISSKFIDGTRIGTTPVMKGVAMPHMSIEGITRPEMVIVRAKSGIEIPVPDLEVDLELNHTKVKALIFLISPLSNSGQHLRILAHVARRVDHESFMEDWLYAHDERDLKGVLLNDEHILYLSIKIGSRTESLIGKSMRELGLPPGNLIPVIHRGDTNIVPRGDTVLRDGDRMTILGDPEYLRITRAQYAD